MMISKLSVPTSNIHTLQRNKMNISTNVKNTEELLNMYLNVKT